MREAALRRFPAYVGAGGLASLLVNRAVLVSLLGDEGTINSTQSRADVVGVFLAGFLFLFGLALQGATPKDPPRVALDGLDRGVYVDPGLEAQTAAEAVWVWDTLSRTTSCASALAVRDGILVLRAGLQASEGGGLSLGPIVQACLHSGQPQFFGNLATSPGRGEFSYFPANTQCLLVVPFGPPDSDAPPGAPCSGVLVLGSDRQRGFSARDQGWVQLLVRKLDATLSAAGDAGST